MVTGTQIMMVGAAVSAVFFWLSSFYYASGRIALWTKAYGLYTVLIIGLGWIFIQQWGFVGFTMLITLGKILFTLLMGGLIIAWGKLRNENLHLPSSR
jgi:O-antigen/teichoic acid export membrane protein